MKLVSINELTHLLGVQRETVRKRLANLTSVDGPKQAKLYDSVRAIRAILGVGGDGKIDYNEAQKRLAVAKTEQTELQNEVLRKERIDLDSIETVNDQVFTGIAGILKARVGKTLSEEDVSDMLTDLREIGARLRDG